MSELRKYVYRFGILLFVALPIMLLTQGGKAVSIILFKLCLVAVAVALAELVWMVAFKPVFHKVEELKPYEKRTVLIFRGLLYAAVILALCLGL